MRGKKVKQLRAQTARKEAAVIAGLTQWWDGHKDDYTYAACILVARITTDVLTHFKIPHRVVPVKVNAMNPQRFDRISNLADGDDGMEFRDGEYSVGANDGSLSERGFGGHLIVVTSNDCVVDLTNYQFDRPEHDIVTGDSVRVSKVAGIFHDFVVGKEVRLQLDSGMLLYWAIDTDIYRDSPDWRLSRQLSQEAIDAISNALAMKKANA